MSDNWREHPLLQGHLSEKHPDDIQVWIQEQAGAPDGPPPFRCEMVWMRVTGCSGNTIKGLVLNSPFVFKRSVKQSQEIEAEIQADGRCVTVAQP